MKTRGRAAASIGTNRWPTVVQLVVAIALAPASMAMAAGDMAARSGPATVGGWRTTVMPPTGLTAPECGTASWYGGKFVGKPTANGEIYDPETLTAAHKKLKFGTRVRVTQTGTGQSVIVRINNRGPFVAGRVIDLSEKAATLLAFKGAGLTKVCLSVLPRPK